MRQTLGVLDGGRMRVVKFCRAIHNPGLSGTGLQVCALSVYRTSDNAFIRDPSEGVIGNVLHPSRPVSYTGDQVGAAFGGGISGNGTIHISGAAIKLVRPIPDAYIFCTSLVDVPLAETARSLGYNSWYVISDVDEFAKQIAHEIANSLGPRMQVAMFHGQVSYHQEKSIRHMTIEGLAASQKSLDPRLYFLKSHSPEDDAAKVFTDEREYRFVFVPVGADGRTAPIPTPCLRLDAGAVRHLLEGAADAGDA